jgi:hypothetical protein
MSARSAGCVSTWFIASDPMTLDSRPSVAAQRRDRFRVKRYDLRLDRQSGHRAHGRCCVRPRIVASASRVRSRLRRSRGSTPRSTTERIVMALAGSRKSSSLLRSRIEIERRPRLRRGSILQRDPRRHMLGFSAAPQREGISHDRC